MRIRDWSSDVCSSDLALGADDVARAFAAAGCEVVRTGSRGLFSIETLVEVESAGKRIGFGPVGPEDVAAVLDEIGRAPLCESVVPSVSIRVSPRPFKKNQELISLELIVQISTT